MNINLGHLPKWLYLFKVKLGVLKYLRTYLDCAYIAFFICMTPETAVSSRTLSFFLLLNLESVLLCCFAMSDQSQLSSSPQQVKIYIYLCMYVYISIYIVICLDDFQIILVITWYFVYLFLLEISIFSYLLFGWRHRLSIIDTKWFLLCTIFNCVIFLSNLTYISCVK